MNELMFVGQMQDGDAGWCVHWIVSKHEGVIKIMPMYKLFDEPGGTVDTRVYKQDGQYFVELRDEGELQYLKEENTSAYIGFPNDQLIPCTLV